MPSKTVFIFSNKTDIPSKSTNFIYFKDYEKSKPFTMNSTVYFTKYSVIYYPPFCDYLLLIKNCRSVKIW